MNKIERKIPKIIHYCWFGGNELTELAKKSISSWKKYCPEYEIIEWNEKNFNINYNEYVKEAYESRKWAFVSDVARLYALVNYGGIYLDTDVEIIKPIDDLLCNEAFVGFENETKIQTAVLACCKNNDLFIEFLNDYKNLHFVRKDGSFDLTTNVVRITNICENYGLKLNNCIQNINGLTVLPKDYLCPKDYLTNHISITNNTYVIHHFESSWHSEEQIYAMRLEKKFHFYGGSYLAKLLSIIHYRGIICALKEGCGWLKRRSE